MKTLKALLIKGPGPSSSHTIGPYRIIQSFLKEVDKESVKKIEITLFGSLALTGKGHFTDNIIKKALFNFNCEIFFNPTLKGLKHPNTMECKAIYFDGTFYVKRYQSIGGGAFKEEDGTYNEKDNYPFNTFSNMVNYMKKEGITDCYSLIERFEDDDIFQYGKNCLIESFNSIEKGLNNKTILPGNLKLVSVSKDVYQRAINCNDEMEKRVMYLTSFAYAISENNARGEMVITSPTCGSAGVVPSCLYYEYKINHYSLDALIKAYLVGALVCDFIKENASLSGALLGCQAEIGSASSFAGASLCYLHNLDVHQIEYASEVSMEHFLGLTCDPVDGYVQIPCIERNAMAAIHAYSSYLFAKNISPYRMNKVSFDNVIIAMKETGLKLADEFKETSLGGLAKVIHC